MEREREIGTSAAAIRRHYDVDPRFYSLWLDPTMAYSCALWAEGDDLEAAQIRKFDHHIQAAGAAGAERVLDIGCGFGGLMRRMVEHHGVALTMGLTLSDAQARWVEAWGDPRCQVRVESWAAHEAERPYDAIICVGALEHAARLGVPREARIAAYRSFFQRCHAFLRPGRRLSLQSIVKGSTPLDRESARDTMWILEEVYPESDLPRLAEISAATEGLFAVARTRMDGDHYARTCAEWLRRLRARRSEAVEIVGEGEVAKFDRYLSICVKQFDRGIATLTRMELQRL